MSAYTLESLSFEDRQSLLSEAQSIVCNRQWAVDRASLNLDSEHLSDVESVLKYAEQILTFVQKNGI